MPVQAKEGLQLQTKIRLPRQKNPVSTGPLTTREFLLPVDGVPFVAEERRGRTIPVIGSENVLSSERGRKVTERPSESEGTSAWINYFDTHWKQEGLPQAWYNLKSQESNKRVGFMMSRQMASLTQPEDRGQVLDWAQKTRRDLQGFKLEFLSDHNVYPRKYQISHADDPTGIRIEDPMYGKSKDPRFRYADIEEIVSEEERKGSVKRAMKKTKEFMATAPVGSMTVLTSPLGETGFKTDEGADALNIDYPDSYFFLGVKVSETEMMNYTIKTNFELPECREVIFRLTGEQLPADAPLEAYADALTMIRLGEQRRPQNVLEVLNVLESVHPEAPFVDKQNGKVNSWNDVKDDIVHGERLYDFDKKTTDIIDSFTTFAEENTTRAKLDYQKAIAATILNMAEHFFVPQQPRDTRNIIRRNERIVMGGNAPRFGDILERTAERRGCSGGGTATVSTAGGERAGVTNSNAPEWFSCSECGWQAVEAIGDKPCGGCGFTKEKYKEKYGVVC